MTVKNIYLKTPDFSAENILEYKVGVRPYRKNGIRIEAEYVSNKLIIHSYGYGGSGLTLCFGGAQEVIKILNEEKINHPEIAKAKTIAILGAGVIGMATAYDLLSQGYEVNIYADEFSPHLTSNVAAGYLGISSLQENMSDEQNKLLNRMFTVSMQRFLKNVEKKHPEFCGVNYTIDYEFQDEDSSSGNSVAGKFSRFSLEEQFVRVQFDNGITKTGKQFRELGLDGKIFIEDLYAKIQAKGAKFKKQCFKNRKDIEKLSETIIINCTSMGSRELFNDDNLLAIRGHLIHFKPQEAVDYSIHYLLPHEPDYWVMLYPWSDRLILGGVFERDSEEIALDQSVINKLLKNARDFING